MAALRELHLILALLHLCLCVCSPFLSAMPLVRVLVPKVHKTPQASICSLLLLHTRSKCLKLHGWVYHKLPCFSIPFVCTCGGCGGWGVRVCVLLFSTTMIKEPNRASQDLRKLIWLTVAKITVHHGGKTTLELLGPQ